MCRSARRLSHLLLLLCGAPFFLWQGSPNLRVQAADRQVLLLTRTSPDETVEYYRRLLTGAGISFTEIRASQVGSTNLNNAVIIAGFSAVPSEFQSVAGALLNAVSSGSWMIADAFGMYVLSYAGVGRASAGYYSPAVLDKYGYVRAIDQSPLFDGIPAWDPPDPPERTEQYLNYLTATRYFDTVSYSPPSSGIVNLRYWGLTHTPGWNGLATDSSYCRSWGGCRSDRTVGEGAIPVLEQGSGKILLFQRGLGVVGGYHQYGAVTGLMARNFIRWAGAGSGGGGGTPPPAQTGDVVLAAGTANGRPGSSVELPVTLTARAGSPASFQADVTFDTQKLTFSSARRGEQLAQAGKELSTQSISANTVRLVGAGLNQNSIGSGPVGYLTFTLSGSFTSGDTSIALSRCQAVDAQGRSMATGCTGGKITAGASCGCDVNGDGSLNVADVQLIINQVLGVTPATCDVNGDGAVNIADVQRVINAVLGQPCN